MRRAKVMQQAKSRQNGHLRRPGIAREALLMDQPRRSAPHLRAAAIPSYAVLGTSLPNVPVFHLQVAPQDPNVLVAATFGRGVYTRVALFRKLCGHPPGLVYGGSMRRIWGWFSRVTAFRIGLFTGLAFAAIHLLQLAGRTELPILTRMEGALTDLRFLQRVQLFGSRHSGQVVVAAVDVQKEKKAEAKTEKK